MAWVPCEFQHNNRQMKTTEILYSVCTENTVVEVDKTKKERQQQKINAHDKTYGEC